MDVDGLWNSVLGEIELEVSRGQFISFFKNTRLSTSGDKQGSFIIHCPNLNDATMLKTRYLTLIKRMLEERIQQPVSLLFNVSPHQPRQAESPGPLFESVISHENVIRNAGLNPNYTFESFAVSDSNQMAHAASQAVSTKLGQAYNPLFLWGVTGVGKTHLMQAIGREVLLKNPQTQVIYCTGEEFTNEIIEAIRTRTSGIFKRKYRNAQLFMVDDVQFIAGKESVQTEFFHTFNSILNSGSQVVLTSDKPPSAIKELETRLRSRFEGGLIIDITPPNFELRTAILLIKAQSRGISIPIDAAKSLAANIEDVRAIEGALLRYSTEERKGTLPYEAVSHILSRARGGKPLEKNVRPDKIIELFAVHFDLKPEYITGKSRKKQFTEPRQLLMYLLRHEMGISFTEIGKLLGGRDHTTIMHGVEKITSLLPKKEHIREDLSQVRHLIWG
ncbi:MAG: chromosomal replication initiator protein DnaA, chromosomal replication initiator protein [Microgenomates group bacterium GW2011_GWC1_41_8]|nr:MAG: chromosomal replication initiator protein DnaA, chromosomal replication initiator protein [Microgenomates group bacterium GW2011_GWC1_41_8]